MWSQFAFIALLAQANGVPAETMSDRIAAREQALDQIRVTVVSRSHAVDPSLSPLDSQNWFGGMDLAFDQRFVISRPDFRVESLTDCPEAGYGPETAAIADGSCTTQRSGIWRDGSFLTVYKQRLGQAEGWTNYQSPVRDTLDLGLTEGPLSYHGVASLFEAGVMQLVSATADTSTYAGEVSEGPEVWEFEFTFMNDGTPLHLSSRWRIESIVPVERDIYVLETTSLNGARLPSHVVSTLWNPNVDAGLAHRDVWDIRVTAAEHDSSICAAQIRIDPVLRDCIVTTVQPDGTSSSTRYDAQGHVVPLFASLPWILARR